MLSVIKVNALYIRRATNSPRVTNQWLMLLKEHSHVTTVEHELKNFNASFEVKHKFKNIPAVLLSFPEIQMNEVIRLPNVSEHATVIEPNHIVSLSEVKSWGLDRLNQRFLPLDLQFDAQLNGSGVHVYVLDTGIKSTHSEFEGRVVMDYSFDSQSEDCQGHGTHTAGTIGGKTYGIAKGVTLHSVRVLDCEGLGTYSGMISAIDWLTDNHIKPAVASLSLGGPASTILDEAAQRAVDAGIIFVVASGNQNENACEYSPARVPSVLSVGAIDNNDTRAGFSNYGSCVDIFAPGVDIVSAGIRSDIDEAVKSGTSMATPHVAGVASLLLQLYPTATPSQISNSLYSSASANIISDAKGTRNRLLFWPSLMESDSLIFNLSSISIPGSCASCITEIGMLDTINDSAYHPNRGSYVSSKVGFHLGELRAQSSSADLDLYLYKFQNNNWEVVGISNKIDTSSERIEIFATPGEYLWRVINTKSIPSTYSLILHIPN